MSSCAPDVKTYRILPVVPSIGVVGLLFLTYVALYGAAIIDWKLFPKVEGFRPLDRAAIGYIVISGAMGVFLLSSLCIKVTVTTRGLQYKRWFRPLCLLWCDVTRMTHSPQGIDICLWTGRNYVRFGQFLSRGRELLETVKERVSTKAPGAHIVQAQPRFLPQVRKREQGADASKDTERS